MCCSCRAAAGKFYCPRMASMNKPAYAAIQVCASVRIGRVVSPSNKRTGRHLTKQHGLRSVRCTRMMSERLLALLFNCCAVLCLCN